MKIRVETYWHFIRDFAIGAFVVSSVLTVIYDDRRYAWIAGLMIVLILAATGGLWAQKKIDEFEKADNDD